MVRDTPDWYVQMWADPLRRYWWDLVGGKSDRSTLAEYIAEALGKRIATQGMWL